MNVNKGRGSVKSQLGLLNKVLDLVKQPINVFVRNVTPALGEGFLYFINNPSCDITCNQQNTFIVLRREHFLLF